MLQCGIDRTVHGPHNFLKLVRVVRSEAWQNHRFLVQVRQCIRSDKAQAMQGRLFRCIWNTTSGPYLVFAWARDLKLALPCLFIVEDGIAASEAKTSLKCQMTGIKHWERFWRETMCISFFVHHRVPFTKKVSGYGCMSMLLSGY